MRHSKRTYNTIGEFWADICFIMKNRKNLREIMKGTLVTPAFRERLMLAVTAVNECRFCSYKHAQLALEEGISREELSSLLEGTIENCPPDEATALLYAQHWAEKNACPGDKASKRLLEEYGVEKAEAINLVLRLIRTGNYMGNAYDNLASQISFGNKGH